MEYIHICLRDDCVRCKKLMKKTMIVICHWFGFVQVDQLPIMRMGQGTVSGAAGGGTPTGDNAKKSTADTPKTSSKKK